MLGGLCDCAANVTTQQVLGDPGNSWGVQALSPVMGKALWVLLHIRYSPFAARKTLYLKWRGAGAPVPLGAADDRPARGASPPLAAGG